jgi:hypothetical protein
MKMKPHGKLLGHNFLSDTSYRNLDMVLNCQWSSHHLFGGAPYLDMDTVLNKQRSDRLILSDVLHRRPDVVKNE